MADGRMAGRVAIAGVTAFALAVVALHVLQPALDPLEVAVRLLPSLAGMIHGNAAMVAFLALPVGALFLSTMFQKDVRWREEARVLPGLAVASGISLILFFTSLAPVFVRPGPPILLGLSERVLLAVYAGWLAAASIGLIRQDERVGQGSEVTHKELKLTARSRSAHVLAQPGQAAVPSSKGDEADHQHSDDGYGPPNTCACALEEVVRPAT